VVQVVGVENKSIVQPKHHTAVIMLTADAMVAGIVRELMAILAVATKEEVQVTLMMIMMMMFHC
jgi:hypothetical protein